MASLQYGGSVGFTSDFLTETVSPSSLARIRIRAGGSGFFGGLGFLEVWVSSAGSIAGGPTGTLYSLFVKYWNGLTNAFVTTSSVQVIAIATTDTLDPITEQATYHPPPQQTVEVSWTSATQDSVTHLFTADGTIQVKVGGSTVINLSSLPLYHGTTNQWNWVSFAPQSFTTSLYVLDRSGFCSGYGQVFATPATYQLQYPGPVPVTIPLTAPNQTAAACTTAGAHSLYSANMNDVTAGTLFAPTGPWSQGAGSGMVLPNLDTGGQTWGAIFYASADTRQFLLGHSTGFIYNTVAFTPPPIGVAALIVSKLTVPPGSPVAFDFAAGGGLDPATFTLSHGESQSYNALTPGDGYSIVEAPPFGWAVSYDVSNDSPVSNITVGSGETVTVTVTDTNIAVPGYNLRQQVIRRQRRTPHFFNLGQRIFISELQLDLEAGRGATTGQGSDPQVMLRLSRDGGHTWGTELWASAGRIGEYTRRVIWRRLGYGRDWVAEFTVSDPVPWNLVNLWLTFEEGLS